MILPTKHIPLDQSLIGAGAVILQLIHRPISVSRLWVKVREVSSIGNFERFILTLDMLHIIGAIELENNKIKRVENDTRYLFK